MTTTITGATGIDNIQAATGAVLQVVGDSNTTSFSTSSNSYVATNLSVTITPVTTSSKVLINFSTAVMCQDGNNDDYTYFLLKRNNTTLGDDIHGNYIQSTDNIKTNVAFSYIDSPSSTSALTYTVYLLKQSAGTALMTGFKAITAMEIAG